MPPSLAAVVLAAGRSSRMGRDKALLERDGVPMWQRQRDVLAGVGVSELLLSARPDQEWAYSVAGFTGLIHDSMPDCGPIMGITAALERASSDRVAVLAIDLPRMTSEWLRNLASNASAGIGAVGRRGDFFEPLAAIYPRELRWLAWEAIARGEYSLQSLLRASETAGLVRVVDISDTDAALFENWNASPA